MNFVTLTLFCAIATALLPVAVQADSLTKPFSYRVEIASDQNNCAEQAKQLASRFSKELGGAGTSISGVTGTCTGTRILSENGVNYTINTIVVSYQGETEGVINSTVFSGSAFLDRPVASTALFSTYGECLSELTKQKDVFEIQTGLIAIALHCDAVDFLDGTSGYSLTIDSCGPITRNLYEYDEPGADWESATAINQTIQAVQGAIKQANGKVVLVKGPLIFYYSDQPIYVSLNEFGNYSSSIQCDSQVAQVKRIADAAKLNGTSIFCKEAPGKASSLELVYAGLDSLPHFQNGDRYASFEDCAADEDRVVQNYISKGYKISGAICSQVVGTTKSFFMDIYFPSR